MCKLTVHPLNVKFWAKNRTDFEFKYEQTKAQGWQDMGFFLAFCFLVSTKYTTLAPPQTGVNCFDFHAKLCKCEWASLRVIYERENQSVWWQRQRTAFTFTEPREKCKQTPFLCYSFWCRRHCFSEKKKFAVFRVFHCCAIFSVRQRERERETDRQTEWMNEWQKAKQIEKFRDFLTVLSGVQHLCNCLLSLSTHPPCIKIEWKINFFVERTGTTFLPCIFLCPLSWFCLQAAEELLICYLMQIRGVSGVRTRAKRSRRESTCQGRSPVDPQQSRGKIWRHNNWKMQDFQSSAKW